jgi:hypothetical protein
LSPRSRRSRRRGWRIALGFLSFCAAGVWAAAFLLLRPAPAPRAAVPTVEPSPIVSVPPDEPLPVFARASGIGLHLSSPDVLAVAFHEASMPDAVGLRPTGVCVVCRNDAKFDPPAVEDPDIEYLVMDPRGRSQEATSAVDLVMSSGTVVLSPVTGTVVSVKRYRLYYQYPDVRVEIHPRGVPDRRVVVIHLEHVKLEKGQEVEASVTPLGTVRRFPFESQVDRYIRGTYPHAHMEVKRPEHGRRDEKDPKG